MISYGSSEDTRRSVRKCCVFSDGCESVIRRGRPCRDEGRLRNSEGGVYVEG